MIFFIAFHSFMVFVYPYKEQVESLEPPDGFSEVKRKGGITATNWERIRMGVLNFRHGPYRVFSLAPSFLHE